MGTVRTQTTGRVRVVTIDRPHRRNAVDIETASALFEVFDAFDRDPAVDVAVLTGAGSHFCAGADLKSALAEDLESRLSTDTRRSPMGPARMDLSKPVIAAIEGYAVAGGLELAVWCDLRVAAEDAVMGVHCRRIGVPLVDLGTVRLPRLIGHSRAMDLILTGRPVDAREALEIGLVNRLVPKGEALSEAVDLAAEVARHPQLCLRNDRQSAISQWGLTEREAMLNEARLGTETIRSGETLKGIRAFSGGAGRHGGPV